MPDNRRSKRLSYWLRHAPDAAGLPLDDKGWAATAAILRALDESGLRTTFDELAQLVADSDKQRFELSNDGERIRARQGHSISVDGEWPEAAPPEILYHGTTGRFVEAIMKEGLLPQRRHHVHLSATTETARTVGARRGKPVVLSVAAGRMAADGFRFYLSSNGVWLVEHVPPAYLARCDF